MAKENNMNFQDLYQKIRNIEEGVAPVEECGMPMSMPSPGQQDSVTMSVNMNGNGSGGIKDLMNILKNIEQGSNPMNPYPRDAERLFGDGYENSEQGDQGAVTLDIADITQTGDDMHSKGHEAPKVNGGGNPMQEALVGKLSAMYQTIKEETQQQDLGNGFMLTSIEAFGSTRPAVLDTQGNTYFILNQQTDGSAIARTPGKYLTIKDGKTGSTMGGPQTNAAFQKAGLIKEDKFDPLKHVKNPTKGEKDAAKDVKRGSYADRAAMLKSAEADGRLKQEAYNPNSVDAEHRRSLEKSYEDTLKKKAAEGDETAKKRLQALKDKKERMRNDYNDRMER